MRHIVALKFFWYNLNVAIPYTGIERGVTLGLFTSFIVSVVAGVVSYYICKWLDGDR